MTRKRSNLPQQRERLAGAVERVAGLDAVRQDVALERLDRREFLLVADPADEGDVDDLAVEVTVEVEHPGAMFKEAGARRRSPRLKIGFELSRGKMFAFQKGYGLIEHTGFSRDFEEVDYGVRQPQQIVGNAGANAASRRRMPPVLDVALDELARSSTQ